MRNGKLNKQEMKALHRAWDIVAELVDWKDEHGEHDSVHRYADRVEDDMVWLMGALREQ